MDQKFMDKFRSHWIGIKFYSDSKIPKDARRLSGVRFCEAVDRAVMGPYILGKNDISCSGANYVFNIGKDVSGKIINLWREKNNISNRVARSIIKNTPRLKKNSVKYIGLNTDKKPDLLISRLAPEDVMRLLSIYHRHVGGVMNFRFSGFMSVCGDIAVRTYLGRCINISFGCEDSREHGNIGSERLLVGVPSRLFGLFVD